MSDRGDKDDFDGVDDIYHEAEEIALELPELICDPDDESAEEAAMHIEDPNRS